MKLVMQDGMRSDWPWICVGCSNRQGLACVSYWRFLRRWIAKLRTKHGYVGRCGERLNDGRK